MLDQFQQALSDLTASPDLVSRVRLEPEVLRESYTITEREWRRLVAVANHPGMACNCMLYRANRLAPVAITLPQLCRLLGKDLRGLLSEYWTLYPQTDVHFLLEAYRFCEIVRDKIGQGVVSAEKVLPTLKREMAALSSRIESTYVAG